MSRVVHGHLCIGSRCVLACTRSADGSRAHILFRRVVGHNSTAVECDIAADSVSRDLHGKLYRLLLTADYDRVCMSIRQRLADRELSGDIILVMSVVCLHVLLMLFVSSYCGCR